MVISLPVDLHGGGIESGGDFHVFAMELESRAACLEGAGQRSRGGSQRISVLDEDLLSLF